MVLAVELDRAMREEGVVLMVGSKSRQAPRQTQRVLVEKYPESFEAELIENGVYTQITDTTTGRSVAVPTSQTQVVQTVLEAFLPKGGASLGVPAVVEASGDAAPADTAIQTAPEAEVVKDSVPKASKAPAAKAKPGRKPAAAKSATADQASKSTATPKNPAVASEAWFDELPASIPVNKRMTLTKVVVAVDEKKKDRVVGLAANNPNLPAVSAYSIEITGIKGHSGALNVGFVLAISETKFVISAPQLGPKTSHRGIVPTTQRLEMLLETSTDQSLMAA